MLVRVRVREERLDETRAADPHVPPLLHASHFPFVTSTQYHSLSRSSPSLASAARLLPLLPRSLVNRSTVAQAASTPALLLPCSSCPRDSARLENPANESPVCRRHDLRLQVRCVSQIDLDSNTTSGD